MKIIFTLLLFVTSVYSIAQERIQLRVLDNSNKSPLAYCNVFIKGTNSGGITNTDGKVILSVDKNDTIVFSYIGYAKKEIVYRKIDKKGIIYLNKVNYELNEVFISANNDYLYDILEKCRNKLLLDQRKQVSKTYYTVKTEANDTILEFLECYYNSSFTGVKLDQLKFKQGRFGLATVDGNYFVTMSTSKAIADIDLLKNIGYFPYIPTQLKKRKLKKHFVLKLIGTSENYFKIGFKSAKNDGFHGSIYIDKNNYNIISLSLYIKNTYTHPFVSLYPSSDDKLSKLTLSLNYQFKTVNGKSYINLIDFDYRFKYLSDRTKYIPPKKIERRIKAKSTLYFYDYNTPFILPYFDFDNEFGDYFSIATIPYNDVFWKNQDSQILLSEEQKEGLSYLIENGSLVNYKRLLVKDMGLFGDTLHQGYFFSRYLHWKKGKRIVASYIHQRNTTEGSTEYNSHTSNLEVQILLDITECKDSLHCRSFTVFDTPDSYYYYPKDSVSDAYLNIYFDICEIERRKMQSKIYDGNLTLSQIDSIYNQTVLEIDNITSQYLKEVKRGHNKNKFKKWNQYIIDELGIDNKSMSIRAWEEKQKNTIE